MGFDEAKIPVRILLIVPAADPQAEAFVYYINAHAPVLGKRLFGFESLRQQFVAEKLSEPFAPQVRIDLFFLPFVGWELVRVSLAGC